MYGREPRVINGLFMSIVLIKKAGQVMSARIIGFSDFVYDQNQGDKITIWTWKVIFTRGIKRSIMETIPRMP